MTYKDTDFFTKHPVLSHLFKSQNIQLGNKIFSNVQLSIFSNQLEQLSEFFLYYPMVFAISKTDIGNIHSPIHLPPEPDAVFKKKEASKEPIPLQDKKDRLLD